MYLGLMMLFANDPVAGRLLRVRTAGMSQGTWISTVAGDMDLPDELKNLIAEKQRQPFKLTYSDRQNLYIAVGYGVQPPGATTSASIGSI